MAGPQLMSKLSEVCNDDDAELPKGGDGCSEG